MSTEIERGGGGGGLKEGQETKAVTSVPWVRLRVYTVQTVQTQSPITL